MTTRNPLPPPGPTRVKVCGITRLDDARVALDAGADFLGFIFYEKSPRYIEPHAAGRILDSMREEFGDEAVRGIGVFVNASADQVDSAAKAAKLFGIQLHGDESLDFIRSIQSTVAVIRAIRVASTQSLESLESYRALTDAFLLDAYNPGAYGGTGETFSHDLARPWINRHPVLLAGGLAPDTVADAVRALRPYGVDVSSRIEVSPGVKDPAKIRAFLRAVRAADTSAPPHDASTA